MKGNSNGKNNLKKLAIITAAAVILVAGAYSINIQGKGDSKTNGLNEAKKVKDSDVVIQVKDIKEEPSFYPANINGTDLEVIAVKASDGTIRTAFNTCQVCYNSGKGYYKIEGNELVCQNCGNRFRMEDVEVTKGGCNPVPITDEYKTVNDKTITISKDFLTKASVIFQNWK